MQHRSVPIAGWTCQLHGKKKKKKIKNTISSDMVKQKTFNFPFNFFSDFSYKRFESR